MTANCEHGKNEGCWRCCQDCNFDLHRCLGCGEDLPHGRHTCAECAKL